MTLERMHVSERESTPRAGINVKEDVGRMKNEVEVVLKRGGEVVSERKQNNLVTTIGRNYVGDAWTGRTDVYALDTGSGFIAVGNGSSILDVSQSGLGNELSQESGGRMLVQSVSRADSASGVEFSCTFSTSGAVGLGIDEVGLFGTGYDTDETTLLTPSLAPDTGALVARAVISGASIDKTESDTMDVSWRLTYAP